METMVGEIYHYNGVWCNTCSSNEDDCKKCLQDDGMPTHYRIDPARSHGVSEGRCWHFDRCIEDIKNINKMAFAILCISPEGKITRCYEGLDASIFDMFAKQLRTDAERIDANKDLAADMYRNGFEDAWYLAKRVIIPTIQGGFSCNELQEIFGYGDYHEVMKQTTASEALAKLRDYEAQKKAEDEAIKVGDELELNDDSQIKAIVTCLNYDKTFSGLSNANGLNKRGQTFSMRDLSCWHKTGRHFSEIDEMFERMTEES